LGAATAIPLASLGKVVTGRGNGGASGIVGASKALLRIALKVEVSRNIRFLPADFARPYIKRIFKLDRSVLFSTLDGDITTTTVDLRTPARV